MTVGSISYDKTVLSKVIFEILERIEKRSNGFLFQIV